MATKIRLQRRGRKGYPFYHIVIAYNPNTTPATITINFDRALYWLQVGAQPTDTTRNILSEEGVLLKKHLLGGVAKGAFTEADAESKFEAWKAEKEKGTQAAINKNQTKAQADAKARLDAEKAANKAKAEAVAQKKAEENAAQAEAEAEASEEVVETPTTETEAPAEEKSAE